MKHPPPPPPLLPPPPDVAGAVVLTSSKRPRLHTAAANLVVMNAGCKGTVGLIGGALGALQYNGP